MTFRRGFDQKAIDALKKTELFSLLKRDACKGDDAKPRLKQDETEEKSENADPKKRYVFPAVRDNSIDFYYGGGRLFHFQPANGTRGEFTTHAKYASVMFDKNDEAANGDVPQNQFWVFT